MDLFSVFCGICLGVSAILCAPTEKPTFYEVIVQKCPAIAKDSKFKEQSQFKSCTNWEKISAVQNLTADNKIDVLCLLYFNSFIQYCNRTKQVNTTILDEATKYNLSTICDKLDILKQVNSTILQNIVKTEDDCKQLCVGDFGLVSPYCQMSYYYNHQDVIPVHNHFLPVKNVESQPQIHETLANTEQKAAELSKEMNPVPNKNPEMNVETGAPDDVNEHFEPKSETPTLTNVADEKPETPKQVVIDKTETNANVDKTDTNVNVNHIVNKETPENNAPVPPVVPVVIPKNDEPSILDKNTETKGSKVDVTNNDPDLGLIDESIQPNGRPESEEDAEEPVANMEKSAKPEKIDETEAVSYATEMDGDSYFFTYFMLLCVIFIVGYVCYHNKQKILALILEGRRGKRQYRSRRPNSANYHKLDSNLEEAITSSCNKNTSNVIY